MSSFPYADEYGVIDSMPDEGMPADEILDQLRAIAALEDQRWEDGRCSGTMYCGDRQHYAMVNEAFGPGVVMLSPQNGACLWGEVVVAARTFQPVRKLEWLLDGEVLATDRGLLSQQRLDVSRHPPGPHRLTARVEDLSGNVGEATVNVVFLPEDLGRHADTSVYREAEDLPEPRGYGDFTPIKPLYVQAREPHRGQVAGMFSTAQVVQVPVEVPQRGYYQLIVDGQAQKYLAFPNVALVVDNRPNQPVGNGPITVEGQFGRQAVGFPFLLEAGSRLVNLVFYNDAADPVTRQDRNCFIDRLELRHLGAVKPDVVPPQAFLLAPADGQVVGGFLDVSATARDEEGRGEIAELRLLIDGREVVRRPGQDLSYRVQGDALEPGEHTIAVLAVDAAGNEDLSREVTITRLPYAGRAPRTLLLPAKQARPSEGLAARLDLTAPTLNVLDLTDGQRTATFTVRGTRPGSYQVRLIARGDGFEGPPVAEVVVSRGGRQLSRVEIPVPNSRYGVSPPGLVRLRGGTHQLTVRLANDRFGGEGRDRNLHLSAVELWQTRYDGSKPRGAIVYPAAGARLSGTELVVAHASDNGAIALAELLVDGRVVSRAGHGGQVGLWLHGRDLTAGPHELTVRVTDRDGHVAASAGHTIHWQPTAPDSPLSPTERGIHLLERLGLGSNPHELARLLLMGEAAWLDEQLSNRSEDDEVALFLDVELLRNNFFSRDLLRYGMIARLLFTRQPVRERLTQFFDNHFSTWIGKTDPLRELFENRLLRSQALGRFPDLLAISATSPAMLAYLDNTENRQGQPNENYARELLELHTLGVDGGYTEADVQELARLLTGWTATIGYPWYEFAQSPAQHDRRRARVLGVDFPASGFLAGRKLLGVLPAHPATGRFVARKLVALLVESQPSDVLVASVAEVFRTSGGDVPRMIRAIVDSPEFFRREHFQAKVKDPWELVIGWVRQGLYGLDVVGYDAAMTTLGMPLFDCVTPDGYPEQGEEWLNSTTLLGRWNLAEVVAGRLTLSRLAGDFDLERPAGQLADDVAMALIGRPLSDESRAAVLSTFGEQVVGEDAMRQVVALVLQMPEAQQN